MRSTARRIALVAALLLPAAVAAHEAEGEAPASSWLRVDKADQHRLGIRTRRADAPSSALTLPARVVADPRGNARVMADQPGILESPGGGFAQPGALVVAGQLLAVLSPSLQEPQRRDLESQLALVQRDLALSRLQIKRYSIDEAKSFEGHLVTPSIQIMVEYHSALAREAQLQRALASRVELRAPVSGRVLRSAARGGAVVAAGETLFELSSPQSLAVEVLLAGEGIDAAAANVALTAARQPVTLRLLGQTIDPVARTPRALYAITRSDVRLNVGEPLSLVVPLHDAGKAGWRIPAAAVFRGADGYRVWVHEDAETFVAPPVKVTAIDAGWVRVDQGLQAAQRVVVDGAATLSAKLQLKDPTPLPAVAGRAQWLEDGTLFVPKALQRTLALRTEAVGTPASSGSIRLLGEVRPDPESRGNLKAPQSGRLESSDAWPLPGERVRKGQVLAWLRPAMTQREDAQRRTDLALLQQKLEVAKINSERLGMQAVANGSAGAVNNVYFEQAELERVALERQLLLAQQGLEGRVALPAPADGIVYAAPARAGEVVAAGQPLFEIGDSPRLWIAATTFDASLAARIRTARLRTADATSTLQLRGVEPLSDQPGWRLLFSVADRNAALQAGQLLPLELEAAPPAAAAASTASCIRGSSGAEVWLHVAAERFERRAHASCADALASLRADERQVVAGAALLAQYRRD